MDIGARVKALRLQLSLTQEELADRCELTKGFISQLENDVTSPSLASLGDILSALGTTFKEFFNQDIDEQVVFKQEDYFTKETDEHNITWLVPNSQKNEMEPILTELAPGKATTKDMPHEGEEFAYVLKGQANLILGKMVYKVREGETFYFSSSRVHYIVNTGDETLKLLWVSSPPTF